MSRKKLHIGKVSSKDDVLNHLFEAKKNDNDYIVFVYDDKIWMYDIRLQQFYKFVWFRYRKRNEPFK